MKHVDHKNAKKVRLPLYWVGHVIVNIFGGTYTHFYRDANNNLTFVVKCDDVDWQAVFPSAKVIAPKGCNVAWVVFEKNVRHWHYAAKTRK